MVRRFLVLIVVPLSARDPAAAVEVRVNGDRRTWWPPPRPWPTS
jgi:hypothetical protein